MRGTFFEFAETVERLPELVRVNDQLERVHVGYFGSHDLSVDCTSPPFASHTITMPSVVLPADKCS